MISFESDYTEGAHAKVLEALVKTNYETLVSYGDDIYSNRAKEKIKTAFGCPGASVYFLTGGTQTNAVVLDSVLKSFEGVICAETGHINVHEAGAIEFTSHKVIALEGVDGKLSINALKAYLKTFFADDTFEHMVIPGAVYISHPTEYGTLYTKAELEEIKNVCREYSLKLYLDGARLGYGLACGKTDVTAQDIARLCDAFYIGGTKVGALCGEAVVFTGEAPVHFITQIKRHGAMIAKGRLTGVQFDALFTDDLYFEIGAHTAKMTELLRGVFIKHGIPFFIDSPTNQQFVILDNKTAEKLSEKMRFSTWQKYDETHTVYRFATSWATDEKKIAFLDEAISQVNK